MNRFGKSFRNRFLAIALAGAMVMSSVASSGMPVFAAEATEAESAEDVTSRDETKETKDSSEEAAEDNEVDQKASEENEMEQQESKKPETESEITSEKESSTTTEEVDTEDEETEELGTETEDVVESQLDAVDNKATTADAVFFGNHTTASWGADGTVKSDNSSQDAQKKIETTTGTYTNTDKDVLFIDASSGKFAYDSGNSGQFQVNKGTKIYVPVIGNKAKITVKLYSVDTKDNLFSDYLSVEDSKLTAKNCTEVAEKYGNTVIECELSYGEGEAGTVCLGFLEANYIQGISVVCGDENSNDYDSAEGDSEELVQYNMEGYAAVANVTGGGVKKEGAENYYTVDNADDFVKTLKTIKTKAKPAVIQITGDLNLGSEEFKTINISSYDTNLIRANQYQALCHPDLKTSGVSDLILKGFSDLTIFSTDGAAIKHCNIMINQSTNIVFRNLVFDELWEWDDLVYYKADKNKNNEKVLDDDGNLILSEGDYDRNDWDYICVDDKSDGVWIDHCTFYKAYDGVIDIKNPKDGGEERVTVSWCKFEEKSAPKVVDGKTTYPFYDAQIQWLKDNIDNTKYYKALMATKGESVSVKAANGVTFEEDESGTIEGEGFSDALIEAYTRGQKKTHLLGQDDKKENAKGIRATFANNIYHNSMDRMPRLRFGIAHVYNAVLDASDIYTAHKLTTGGDKLGGHVVSNGALSTMDGSLFLDTCYIDGITSPINSGNGNSKPGYIGWDNCAYKLNNAVSTLAITYKNNTNNANFKISKDTFKAKLPSAYKYHLYDGTLDNLKSYLSDKAGANASAVNMTALQWTKTSYGINEGGEEGTGGEGGENPPTETDPGDETEEYDFSLSADDLDVGDITSTTEKGFTIKGAVTVDANNKTIEGISFTKRIKLGGTGNKDSRSIHFEAEKAGTLTVYAISSDSNADRPLGLYRSDGTEVKTETASRSDVSVIKYDIKGAGEYYIASASSGINIYFIGFAAKKTEGGGDDDNPPTDPKNPPADYEDSLILNANDLEVEEITKTIKLNDHYTLIGTSEGPVTIKEITEKPIKDKPFTKAISLSGSGNAEKSAIAITAPKAGNLIVYSTGSPVLKTGSEEPQNGNSTETGITEYTIDAAGTYYLYSSGSGIDVYYIEFSEQTQEPPGEEKTETLKFRVDKETTGSLTKDLKVNDYFTIKAISGNGNEIKNVSSETKIGEESFAKYVKLNGTASTDDKSIKIYALGGGTLTIYASSSGSAERGVNLLDSEGKRVSDQLHEHVTTATSFTLEIPEKGIYYVGSTSGGLYIYGIDFEVTYKVGEELPRDPSDADFPQYTMPEGDSVFDASEGNEQSKVVYNMEGYAASANVTGGGLLKEDSHYYIKVKDEKEFLEALQRVRDESDKPHVIEVTTDLSLGSQDLNKKFNLNIVPKGDKTGKGHYTGVIRSFTEQPKIHPILKKTGVSYLSMNGFKNLTIFSKNGATIKHAGIRMEGTSQNIIIRNLTFDELWEWDEQTNGGYDVNDWDYISIEEKSEGIWIDHCTFYKSYDGILDVKQGQTYQRVTVSWCEFLPGSKDNTFFNAQMKWLENNIDSTTYYKSLRQKANGTENMTKENVWWYAYGQKKTHLFGDSDNNAGDVAIRATLANNYYKNSMDRMPRLRYGKVHEYNCILDAQNLNTQKKAGSSNITSQGALSTCNGELLLENCYIRGIDDPLISGNGGAPGYINAVGSVYYMNGSLATLAIKNKASSGYSALDPLDEEQFKSALPYDGYITYDATQLFTKVMPHAGAGKLDLSTVQWEKTTYGDRTGNESSATSTAPNDEPAGPNDAQPTMPSWDEPDNPDDPPADTIAAPTATPADGTQFPSTGGSITLDCETVGVTIYYTKSATESGLTDPSVETNTARIPYTKDTEIPIIEETYIWAVAIKDDKASEPLKCHYTVLAEGEVVKPVATPGSDGQSTAVTAGTKVTLSTTDTSIETIYYTVAIPPNDAADPREENSGRQTYDKEKGITIEEAITIKAVAQKGDKYSDIAIFTYTIKTEEDPDPDKTVAAPTFSKKEGTVEKGEKITIDCETAGASIYYTTDGNEPKAESQFLYTKGTEIVIDKTTTIRAIAVKDGVTSTENKVTYTVNNEELPPEIKTIKLSECTITVPSVMESTKKGWVPQSVTYVTYKYTNENGQEKYVKFAEGVDYTADWTPGKQADGTYKVILTGRGRTTDGRNVDGFVIDENSTETVSYMVYKKPDKNSSITIVDISKAKVTLNNNAVKNLSYTGYAHEPNLDYSKDKDGLNGKLNIAYKNNINAGKASVIISAKPDADTDTVKYVGSKTLTFTIKKAALNKDDKKATAIVSFDKVESEKQQYISGAVTAKGLKVETVVTSGNGKGVTLRKDEDYTVTYKNSVKNGIVTVTMTVKGVGNNLSGNCAKTFTMQQLDLTNVSLTEGNDGKLPYSSKGAKLGTITITQNGSTCTLKEGVDYTAKYEYDKTKKKDAGSNVKITVKGKGVCKGQSIATFDIVQADFNSADIIVSEDVTVDTDDLKKSSDAAKKAKVFEKSFTVKDAAGAKLSANKDYKITPDSANKKITIEPIGKNAANYTGKKTFSYREAKNLAKDKNFIFNQALEKSNPLAYDGRNPVKITTADIDYYINKISSDAANYNERTYRLGGQNANIEIVPGTYKNNTKKGTAQVTVRGIAGVDGGFYGTKVLKFKIVEK